MEQTKRALLAMHALTERRREAGGGGDEAALSPAEVAAHGERLLREWSELAPLSTTEDAGGPSALHHLDRIGLLEWRAGPDRQDGAETAGESVSGADVRVQMVPLGEAVRRGSRYWGRLLERGGKSPWAGEAAGEERPRSSGLDFWRLLGEGGG